MSLQFNILQRISNVHWSEGVEFVFGGFAEGASSDSVGTGNLYYVKFKGTEKDELPAPHTIAMPRAFEAVGSSYHLKIEDTGDRESKNKTTPIFLVCGSEVELITTVDGAGNEVRFSRSFAMIYKSSDGLTWTQVHEDAGTGDPFQHDVTAFNAVNLVWNSEHKAFYYDQAKSVQITINTVAATEEIYQSSDGESWAHIDSIDISGVDDDYRSQFATTYCRENDCFDEREQHVPDGVMNEDKDETSMQPVEPPITFYETGNHSWGFEGDEGTHGSNEVKIKTTTTDENGTDHTEESTTTVSGIQKVMCVGGSGDIWMAGGFAGKGYDDGGAVAITKDRGKTWTVLMETPRPILTLSAGGRDVEPETPTA